MASIYLRLSSKADKTNLQSEILIRFKHGKVDQRAKSNIFVNEGYWDSEKQSIKIPTLKGVISEEQKQNVYVLQEQQDRLNKLTSFIQTAFLTLDRKVVDADWLKNLVHDFNFPPQQEMLAEWK